MGKGDSEIVRLAAQHVFDLFSGANGDFPLIFHGYERSRGLVDDCRDIAKGNDLNSRRGDVLLLSAWFHDAAYAVTSDGSKEKSIELARGFLKSHRQTEGLADAVAACLGSTDRDDDHGDLENEVLHDALLAPLASKDFIEEAELLRLEEQNRSGKTYSDVEWTRRLIEHLQKNPYRTRWAKLEYDGGRARNLSRLYKLLRRQLDEATEQKAEEAKSSKNAGRTVEGLFGDLTRNLLRTLSIADRRTATMIHVNAIMITIVVGLVMRKIEEHRNLILPTIVLLAVNLAVVVMSIVSMRAGRELRYAREEMPVHDANLLVTTNNVKIHLSDFMRRMENLVGDPAALQKELFEYLYFLRNLLIYRKRNLQLSYDVFIYGLAGSIILFTVAVVWQ
ncbi:MAG TPA: Pycsar system effector family protein [Myxococcales bacterium]|nr:Pycsar system effector family protein [Myxococcales bacterium]